MRAQQVRGTSVFRRAALRRRVQAVCNEAMNLPYQDGIPPRKWDKAKKIFCKNLMNVVQKMDKFDDYSISYFENRVSEKVSGGALAAVTRTVHTFVGI